MIMSRLEAGGPEEHERPEWRAGHDGIALDDA
jgi:hypothetical protein